MKLRSRIAVILSWSSLLLGFSVGLNGAAQRPATNRLTLQDAIQKGLQANLGVLISGTRVEEAEGTRLRSLSAALLPRVTTQAYANVQNRDLRAFGISLPGTPEVVGPFSNYDVRVYAQQNIVDLASYRQLKAAQSALDAGKMDYQDARDLIVRSVAALYLNAQSAAARANAAQSRVTDSSTLLKLAKDKHDAGTATGVDVLRAQVQLANDKQALLVAENQYKQSLLTLARNLGLSPGTPLELAETLQYRSLSQPEPETLVSAALLSRADYLSLARQREGLAEQQRANAARWYPKLSLNGNFGGIGRSIGGIQGTGLIQGQVDFAVFDRDRSGEAQQIASRLKRIDEQAADLRLGVEQDIREAILNLESAAEQAAVAKDGQDLAQRELELSQDRFQSGTANNVEVVTAQDELALGDTEKRIAQFMGNP
jgi:outer membrane protein TolC